MHRARLATTERLVWSILTVLAKLLTATMHTRLDYVKVMVMSSGILTG